jgi:Na+-driven multidrug efflux pump
MTLAMGLYIMVASVLIVRINFRISKRITGTATALLPLHIMAIAISYIFLVVSTHLWVLYRFGNEGVYWYGLPLIVIADVIGIFALGVIWRFQHEKRKVV